MSVKRVKISLVNNNNKSISIPLRIDSVPMDNTDMIDNDFVLVEKDKAINPIIDYEKVRAVPYYSGTTADFNDGELPVEKIKYNLYFTDGSTWGSHYGSPELEDGVFSDKDLKYRLNRFKNSFLRQFYNTTKSPTNGKLLEVQTIYTQLGDDNVYTYNVTPTLTDETNIKSKVGTPLPVKTNPIRLIVGNNINTPSIEPDGYFLYWAKRLFPQTIYLSYTFNNAKNGKVTILTPKNLSAGAKLRFSELNDITNIPIEMKEYNGEYRYIIKEVSSHDGISYDKSTKTLTINLYQRKSDIV